MLMRYEDLCILDSISVRDTIKALDKTAKKILIVTIDNKLEGIVTDGDIRRFILNNGDLNEEVNVIMNKTPIYLHEGEKNKATKIMKEKMIEAVPIVNSNKEVVDIVFWNDAFAEKLNHYNKVDAPVVIMAGGKGTRLYPYTKILPKPLIPIGDTPIIERIINRFSDYGCNKFYITINYKKNMIKAYFNEIDKNYEVDYIDENKPLGTGGSLYYLKNKLHDTFFVSNCDVLIDANYYDILKYHKENKNKITVVTSLKNYTIPYGVIQLNNNCAIESTLEKPEYNFLVNTGVYVLEPEVLSDIPKDQFYHITNLIDKYLEEGKKVGTYPITEESWLDMGEFNEMERMIERLGI